MSTCLDRSWNDLDCEEEKTEKDETAVL